MKKIILGCLVCVFLIGCGPTEAEKQKIKKEKEEHEFIENVKTQVKDPDSVKFRNVKGNCGELNAKNGFGAYVGFKRFLVRSNGQLVIENEDENIAFIPIWKDICKGNDLVISPETTDSSLPEQARVLNLNPQEWDKLTPKQQKFGIEVANETLKRQFIEKQTSKGMSYERAKYTADAIIESAGVSGLANYNSTQ